MRKLFLVLIFECSLRLSSSSKYGYINHGDIPSGNIQRGVQLKHGSRSVNDDFDTPRTQPRRSDGGDFPTLKPHDKQRFKTDRDNNEFILQIDADDENQKNVEENDGGDSEKLIRRLNDEQELDYNESDYDNQQRAEANKDYGSNEKLDGGLDDADREENDYEDREKYNPGEAKNQGDKKKQQETEEESKESMIFDPDYDKTEDDEVNSVEYKDNCPEDCPTRQVMVCARCQHNIHRTFLSVCHLRMFNCEHPHEKLELVSRRPCVESAPYLTDFHNHPAKAKLSAPGDQDTVLKFIRCREKGRLERDPRCEFR